MVKIINIVKQNLPYIIIVVLLGIIYSIWVYPFLQRKREAEEILTQKLSELERFHSSEGPPSLERVTAMEEENKILRDEYIKVKNKLPIVEKVQLPEGVSLALFYLEELKNVEKELEVKAQEKGVKIGVKSLGLPSKLPREEEAPSLIKDLNIIKRMINLLIEIGVESIDSITIGEVKTSKDMEEIPLSLKLTCDIFSLTKLLSYLEKIDKELFIIRNLELIPEREVRVIRERIPAPARREIEVREPGELREGERVPPPPSRHEPMIDRIDRDEKEKRIEEIEEIEEKIKVDLDLSIIRCKD